MVDENNFKNVLNEKEIKWLQIGNDYIWEAFRSNKESYYEVDDDIEILDFSKLQVTKNGYLILDNVGKGIMSIFDCETGTIGYIKASYGGDDSLHFLINTLSNVIFEKDNVTIGYWLTYTEKEMIELAELVECFL